jgi:hypothetical protein
MAHRPAHRPPPGRRRHPPRRRGWIRNHPRRRGQSYLIKWKGGGIGNPFAAIGRGIGGAGRELGKTARVGLRQGGKTARRGLRTGEKVGTQALRTTEALGESAIEHGAVQAAAAYLTGGAAAGMEAEEEADVSFDEAPPEEGMSTTVKIGIALAVGFGLFMLTKKKKAA